MLSISDLVHEKRRFENITPLGRNLGDGYLYNHNPIFRNIREHSQRLGVTFSDRPGIFDYQTCANLAFQEILQNRTVPYLNNVQPLLRMSKLNPRLPANRMLEIKKNNILHESAHLVSHATLGGKLPKRPSKNARDLFILKSLLSEAYACACETVGQTFALNDLHTWMYRQNTNVYGCDRPDYQSLLSLLNQKFGLRFCFKLSVLSFLCWNFFYLSFKKDDLEKVLPVLGVKRKISATEQKKLLEYCDFHFHIHGWFRKQVAEFYFSCCGLAEPLAELLQFDFLSYLLPGGNLNQKFEKLVDVALGTNE